MSLVKIKTWLVALCVSALGACGGGGGGDAGTPFVGGGSGGNGSTGPTVTLALSSSTVTPANPAVLTVTVRDAKGSPIEGRVVDLAMVRGGLATLSVVSAATATNGSATAAIIASTGGVSGADEITATVTIGTTTVSGRVAFTVAGSAPVISLSASTTTLRVSTGAVTLQAEVRDAAGAPVPNLPVTFASGSGRVVLGAPSALTNSAGVATVLMTPSAAGVSAADVVTATASVSGQSVSSSFPVQLVADVASIRMLASASVVTAASPATLTISVKDANGAAAPAGTILTLSSSFGLTTFDATTVATNASGVATAQVRPVSASSNGADQVVAKTTLGGVDVSAALVLQASAGAGGLPTVTVALNSSTVTAASSITATVTVRDAQGNPLSAKVVDLTTTRSGLAGLSRSSVATDSNGAASVVLSKTNGGPFGSSELVARATIDGVAYQGAATFTVDGSVPVLSLALTPTGSTLRVSDAVKKQLEATLLGMDGLPASGIRVSFAAASGLVGLSAGSVVTDTQGKARITLTPLDASLTAAETLNVSASVGGVQAAQSLAVQLQADTPSVSLEALSATVTAGQPATLRITVRDTSGQPVKAAVVSVSSASSLVSFNQATAATDSSGIATVVASPRSTSSNGADVITARVTVGGVTVTDTAVLQVSSQASTSAPSLRTSLSSTSVSSATPVTVTATLIDGAGAAVPGQVVTFSVVRNLARTNIATALTNASGQAVVVLSPTSSTVAGADEVLASASYAGVSLQSVSGFQIQATNVSLADFRSETAQLGPYAQTAITLTLTGAAVGSPVNVSVSSACVALGKATLSPSTFTATTSSVTLQYKDNGCGAVQSADKLQASIVGASGSLSLDLPITAPSAASIAFVSASPEVIFVKGSGFTESSTLVFEVRDAAGNILPNRNVLLKLLTESGGVTMQNASRPATGLPLQITQKSDASGRVSVLINSGSQPTPVRVSASLVDTPSIATVSSNLSVGVGLPSQLNFSMSQQSLNIEGFDIDGTNNTYTIIAADRSGNPVPVGTSINFVTEGGQVESIGRTSLVSGIARTTVNFQSASPRPDDGRVTVTAYALGEESFIDQNGNNVYDSGEPYQDLGHIHKDRNFDGSFSSTLDEYIPTGIVGNIACQTTPSIDPNINALLRLDPSIPSVGGSTCDGKWSGAGTVYVRRAVQTVFSTSAARLLWADTSVLPSSCASVTLQTGIAPSSVTRYATVSGSPDAYINAASGTLLIHVADANTYPLSSPFRSSGAVGRFNPMAVNTAVSASTPTTGLKVSVVGGGSVPNSGEPTQVAIAVSFESTSVGLVNISVRSPSGLTTSYALTVHQGAAPGTCTP